MDMQGALAQCVLVGAEVVATEQQVSTGFEGDADIRLSAAPIAAVNSRECSVGGGGQGRHSVSSRRG